MGDEVSYHDRILHDTGFATRSRADVQDACLQIASEADQQIADLQSQLLAQEAAVADAWNAERDELQKRLGEVPSENLLRNYKRAAHDIGDLFCWCVANLHLFPPAPGEKPWLEGIKDRLKTGHEADSRIVDELKAMKLRAEAAEAKLAEAKARLIPEEIMLRENAAIRWGLTQNQEQTIALERRNADQRKSNQLLAEKHREVLQRADTAEAKLAAVRAKARDGVLAVAFPLLPDNGLAELSKIVSEIYELVQEPTNAVRS